MHTGMYMLGASGMSRTMDEKMCGVGGVVPVRADWERRWAEVSRSMQDILGECYASNHEE
jgi:hypothetical protein